MHNNINVNNNINILWNNIFEKFDSNNRNRWRKKYRIRKDIIRKITNDHSYVEKLVREGTITREQAQNHPKKNMLMKAIGCHSLAEPDVLYKGFLKDDIVLMCSDGLTNMLKDEEIYSILLNNPENPVKALIDKANQMGGYDNITAIIIDNIDIDEKTKER